MNMKKYILLIIVASFAACTNNEKKSDAYGNFEATDVLVSAEASGKILNLDLDEGQVLDANQQVGMIDTIQLSLKVEQLLAQIDAIKTKTTNIFSQVEVQNEQKKTLLVEKERLDKLLKDGAATTKQMDDINGKINVIEKQINSIQTQNASVFSEVKAYEIQIEQIQDQIKKSRIINPINGTVLEKYSEPSEFTIVGKSIYKIADLSTMYLKIFVSGEQLSNVKIGQKVKVIVDDNNGKTKNYDGEISWISEQAEFTPKVIQTKDERVNLVYATKVKVKNDGTLKIGMPGEVMFK